MHIHSVLYLHSRTIISRTSLHTLHYHARHRFQPNSYYFALHIPPLLDIILHHYYPGLDLRHLLGVLWPSRTLSPPRPLHRRSLANHGRHHPRVMDSPLLITETQAVDSGFAALATYGGPSSLERR